MVEVNPEIQQLLAQTAAEASRAAVEAVLTQQRQQQGAQQPAQRHGPNQEERFAAAAAAAALSREKERASAETAERSRTISFLQDPGTPGSSITSSDIVSFVSKGGEAGPEADPDPTRQATQLQLEAAHRKDLFLPRGAFTQAMQVLFALWTAVGPPAGEGEQSQARLLAELNLAVQARCVDEHWPSWRQYIKRVLNALWAPRGANEGVGFDIGEIHDPTLRMAERDGFHPPFHVDNFTLIGDTEVSRLLRAEGEDIAAVGTRIDALYTMATFDTAPAHLPVQARTPTSPRGVGVKRALPSGPGASPSSRPPKNPYQARARDSGEPFRPAPHSGPSRDGGAFNSKGGTDRKGLTPRFCVTCLTMATHSFQRCPRPDSDQIVRDHSGGGKVGGSSARNTTWARNASTREPETAAPMSITAQHVGGTITALARTSRADVEEGLHVLQAFTVARSSSLKAEAFERGIQILPGSHRSRLGHVRHGVRHGFSMGKLRMPTRVVMAPDHFKHDQQQVIRDWAAKAVAAGFAVGLFLPSIVERVMGPVACVPLTVVHTAATLTKPAKDRVCFNASWDPQEAGIVAGIRSINKEVEDEDWECEWFLLTEGKVGTVLVLGMAVARAAGRACDRVSFRAVGT
ncbi:hypothetical protein V8E36_005103 [Tilletia maclaganii]